MDMAAILKMHLFKVLRGVPSLIFLFQHNNQQNEINAPNILDLVVKDIWASREIWNKHFRH